MAYPGWLIVTGIVLGIFAWQFSVFRGETRTKKEQYQAAVAYARSRNKPLLIAGGPYGNRWVRRFLKMPAHGNGDVCLDIDRNALNGHPNAVTASVTHIPFSDKVFGAAFASHLLEHLPTTSEARQALDELNRTAATVFIVSPSRQSLSGWLHPDHHLWVWQKSETTYIKQRGKLIPGENRSISSIMNNAELTLSEEAELLGLQLFGKNNRKRATFTRRLLDTCTQVEGKDFLLIHNPGGWGGTPFEELLEWEKSIVDGVVNTIERAGYSQLLVQRFRCGRSFWAHLRDTKEEAYFLFKGKSHKAKEIAEELRFITRHFNNLKIILIGASQGAAFSNAIMRQIGDLHQVYSIELGIFFPHMSRRVITTRTLAIDDNGKMPDPIAHRNLRVSLKAYFTTPYRWVRYRIHGQPKKFSYCINAPGHEYKWGYPGVGCRIEEFLKTKFVTKEKLEVRSS